MRKLIFVLLLVSMFGSSCNKTGEKNYIQQLSTSSSDLKTDSTAVSLTQAKLLAKKYLQSKSPNVEINISNAVTIIKNGKPYFHVINANHGFVITSPDSLYIPILAFDTVENFSINTKDLNPGLVMWMNKHANELDFVRNTKNKFTDSVSRQNKSLWKSFDSNNSNFNNSTTQQQQNSNIRYTLASAEPYPSLITSYTYTPIASLGPLCSTQWGQDNPFNTLTPAGSYSVGHTPTGCVPTAVAQLLYYYHYPSLFDYSVMPLNKFAAGGLPSTSYNIFELSFMMLYLGQLMNTQYNDAGSSTDQSNIIPALHLLQYSSVASTTSAELQSFYGPNNGVTYAGLLSSEVLNQRPCLVTGYPSQNNGIFGWWIWPTPSGVGHCWVCDGSQTTNVQITYTYTSYTQTSWGWLPNTTVTNGGNYVSTFLHMNWGWVDVFGANGQNGVPVTNNGWYNCSVNYTQANGGSQDFQYFQVVYYNIQP